MHNPKANTDKPLPATWPKTTPTMDQAELEEKATFEEGIHTITRDNKHLGKLLNSFGINISNTNMSLAQTKFLHDFCVYARNLHQENPSAFGRLTKEFYNNLKNTYDLRKPTGEKAVNKIVPYVKYLHLFQTIGSEKTQCFKGSSLHKQHLETLASNPLYANWAASITNNQLKQLLALKDNSFQHVLGLANSTKSHQLTPLLDNLKNKPEDFLNNQREKEYKQLTTQMVAACLGALTSLSGFCLMSAYYSALPEWASITLIAVSLTIFIASLVTLIISKNKANTVNNKSAAKYISDITDKIRSPRSADKHTSPTT